MKYIYQGIEGLDGSRNTFGTVLTIGEKSPTGNPTNTHQFFIKKPQAVLKQMGKRKGLVRENDPEFVQFNRSDRPELRTVIRFSIVHAVHMREGWDSMIDAFQFQLFAQQLPKHPTHPRAAPACSGDGVHAQRWDGEQYKDIVLELNRLCLVQGHDKNLASYFVAQTLRMLPSPSIVVSYADTSMEHVGYIYQATNFLYTGLSAKRTEWREIGLNTHSRTVVGHYSHEERVGNPDRFAQVDRPQKHRYVYFIGSRREKRELRKALKYRVYPYPKGDTQRYKDGNHIAQQMTFL